MFNINASDIVRKQIAGSVSGAINRKCMSERLRMNAACSENRSCAVKHYSMQAERPKESKHKRLNEFVTLGGL